MARSDSIAWICFVLFSAGLLSSCTLERVARHDLRSLPAHGACVTCHRTNDPSDDSSPLFAGGIEPSAACLDCHHYETNHHPVNIAPQQGTRAASQTVFPLFDGQVKCLTCHQAHSDAGQHRLSSAPMLLRGGPYPDQRAICSHCHSLDEYTRLDPHRMLSADGTALKVNGRPVCLLCHTTQPDPEGDPDLVEFRADVAFLCWRCHPPMEDTFLKNHFHVKPRKKTRTALRESIARHGIDLPIARDGRITCSTCHNPHQAGVVMRAAVRTGADAPKRLRIAASSICEECHAK